MNMKQDNRFAMHMRDTTLRLLAPLMPRGGTFLRWWSHHLASWLPPRLHQLLDLDRGVLLLRFHGQQLDLVLQQGSQLRGVGEIASISEIAASWSEDSDPLLPLLPPRLAGLSRWLLLPAADGLRRRLSLPEAAASRVREVVGFEIDRQTPFSADSVAYDARLLGRAGSGGQLDVELVVMPKRRLSEAMVALGPAAQTLIGVDLIDTEGVRLGVNLLPPAQRRRHADPLRYWNLALVAVAALALAAGMWQLLGNRRTAADVLEQLIARNAAAANSAAVQRQELTDLIEGQAFLDRARAARPTTVELIKELTRRLPDKTYLTKLTIENNKLLLAGLSSEASSLVQRLEGSRLWRAPALTGALQPDSTSGQDRFTLTAELVPPPVPARKAASNQKAAPNQKEGSDGK